MSLTDLDVHAPPASGDYPYSPPANWQPGQVGFVAQGGTYVDPVFGQTHRRISNVYPNIGDSALYSKNGYQNADGTILGHNPNAGGTYNAVDATTGAVLRTLSFSGEPTFDPVNPDVFFYATGTTIEAISVASGVTRTVKNFGATVGNLGQSVDCVDLSGRWWVVAVGTSIYIWDAIDANGLLPGNASYTAQAAGLGAATPGDAGNGGIVGAALISGGGGGWTGIAEDGSMTIDVFNNGTTGVCTWYSIDKVNKTRTQGTTRNFMNATSDHSDFVTGPDGKTYWVGGHDAGAPNDWAWYAMDIVAGTSQRLCDADHLQSDQDVSGVPAGSWKGYVCVAQFYGLEPVAPGSWTLFHCELTLVNAAFGAAGWAANQVQRLGHHRSQGAYYQAQTRHSVNWVGTKVAYLSNYGVQTNSYSDLWTVTLPAVASGSQSNRPSVSYRPAVTDRPATVSRPIAPSRPNLP